MPTWTRAPKHLLPGLTRLKAHLCGILNLGRCVNVCFTDCLLKQDVRIEYYSLVFGKFRIVLTLSVVLWNLCLVWPGLFFCRVWFIIGRINGYGVLPDFSRCPEWPSDDVNRSFFYLYIFLSGKCRMRSCMSGAHYIIHFIFQNIVLSPSFYCN